MDLRSACGQSTNELAYSPEYSAYIRYRYLLLHLYRCRLLRRLLSCRLLCLRLQSIPKALAEMESGLWAGILQSVPNNRIQETYFIETNRQEGLRHETRFPVGFYMISYIAKQTRQIYFDTTFVSCILCAKDDQRYPVINSLQRINYVQVFSGWSFASCIAKPE